MKTGNRESPSFEGMLIGHTDGVVYGWAHGPESEHVVVEILGDDEPMALVRSGLRLPEHLGLPNEHRNFGFAAALGAQRMQTAGRITARIANTPQMLPGVIFPWQTPARQPATFGSVSHRDGLRLFGWVLPDTVSGTGPRVLALIDGAVVAESHADRRDGMRTMSDAPMSACGFDFSLPLTFADGRTHQVTIVTEDGQELAGSPITVRLAERGERRWIQSLALPHADRELLLAMADRWRVRVPQSVDWSAYPDWTARFGAGATTPNPERVLVIIDAQGANDSRLAQTLGSLLEQTHSEWRALVRIDGTAPLESQGPEANAADDPRVQRVSQADWSATLQRRIGDFALVSFLRGGDRWHPELLRHTLAAMIDGVHACYCDAHDRSGGPPWFKPDWCPDTFLALPLLHHGFVFRSTLLPNPSPDPEDWPWQVVAAAGGPAARIAHVPHVLHDCDSEAPASTPGRSMQPGGRASEDLARAAGPRTDSTEPSRPDLGALIRTRFGVAHWSPSAASETPGPNRIDWPDPEAWPSVCLIVPTRDRHDLLRPCLESLRRADYPALSICVIDNQTVCAETLAYLASLEKDGIRVLRWPHPFNYAALHNFAIEQIDAEVIGLVNNDVRALDTGWLRQMVKHLVRPNVGAVGAKLLWPNRMVQHAGVVLGLHGLAGHAGGAWSTEDPGYHHLNQVTRSVSAVTAACMLLRRSDYLAVDGMDAQAFPVAFNDVDLCLKLRARDLRVIWAADAVLEHAESMTRGTDDSPSASARLQREASALADRWGKVLQNDPFYNPNLNLDRYAYDGLAVPPRHYP